MNKNTFIGIGIVAVILIGGAFIVAQPKNTNDSTGSANGDLATIPDVVLETAEGEKVSLLAVINKPSVLNVWAGWCPFCVNELPDFNEFAQENAGSIDVIIINRGESIARGESFLEEIGLSNSALKVFYDRSENFYRGIGGFAMPETVFVNAQGEILNHKRGPLSKSQLNSLVASLGLLE